MPRRKSSDKLAASTDNSTPSPRYHLRSRLVATDSDSSSTSPLPALSTHSPVTAATSTTSAGTKRKNHTQDLSSAENNQNMTDKRVKSSENISSAESAESEGIVDDHVPQADGDHTDYPTTATDMEEDEEEDEDEEGDEDEEDDEDHNHYAEFDPIAMMMDHLAGRGVINFGRSAGGNRSGALSSKFSTLLNNIRSTDPSVQFMAVQELNEVLSMATEETLGPGSGSGFSAEVFLPVLVGIISGESNALGFDNPDLQLMACRCVSNLLEALQLPSTKYAVSSSHLISALCLKLASIEYIDVAEQAISLLAKLSSDHRADILANGGLTSIMSFLDFFPLSVQRTALKCASNVLHQVDVKYLECLYPDASRTLTQLLSYSDEKLVEEAATSIARLVYSLSSARLRQIMAENFRPCLHLAVSDTMIQNIATVLSNSLLGSAGVTVSPSTCLYLIKSLRMIAEESLELATMVLQFGMGELLCTLLNSNSPTTQSNDQISELLDLVISLLPETPIDKFVSHGKNLFSGSSLSKPSRSVTVSETLAPIKFPLSLVSKATGSSFCEKAHVNFATSIVPVLLSTFYTNINMGIRVRILISFTRVISQIHCEDLKVILKSVPFAEFLSRVISRSISRGANTPTSPSTSVESVSSQTVNSATIPVSEKALPQTYAALTYGLALCHLLMLKLPEHYEVALFREGVLNELQNIQSSVVAVDVEIAQRELTDILAAIKTEEEEMKAAAQPPSDGEASDQLSASNSYAARVATMKKVAGLAESYRKKYEEWYKSCVGQFCGKFLHDNMLPEDSQSTALKYLSDASAAAKTLEVDGSLDAVVPLFLDSDRLTSFEFYKSGLLLRMLQFLERSHDNIRLFIDKIMKRDSPALFESLVAKLTDCLIRLEPFEIVRPYSTGLEGLVRSHTASLHQGPLSLIRKIKFRLKPADDMVGMFDGGNSDGSVVTSELGSDVDLLSAFDLRNLLISMPSLAPIKTVEDFLMPKLTPYLRQLSQKPKSPKSVPEVPIIDDESSESHDETPAALTEVTPSSSQSTRVRIDSSFVQNVEVSDRSRQNSIRQSASSAPRTPPTISYANAVTKLSSKWSLEFSIGDMPVDNALMAYGVVHRYEAELAAREQAGVESQYQDVIASSGLYAARPVSDDALRVPQVFASTYTLRFRPVKRKSKRRTHAEEFKKLREGFFSYTSKHLIPFEDVGYSTMQQTSVGSNECSYVDILVFLRILYNLSEGKWREFVDFDQRPAYENSVVQLSSLIFMSSKIAAKVNRQLNEMLISAAGLTPTWCRDICHRFGFLIPLETRLKFLHYTGLGSARALMKWRAAEQATFAALASAMQSSDEFSAIGRISRQKLRISRSKIFESSAKLMNTYAAKSNFLLEVEYFDEVGTGIGPTMEFYSLVSIEWHRASRGMWRNKVVDGTDYVSGVDGLFPAPATVLSETVKSHFRNLGQFIAKSIMDFRLIDVQLHPQFLQRAIIETSTKGGKQGGQMHALRLKIDNLAAVDADLASSLIKLFPYLQSKDSPIDGTSLHDLCLDFTLPGYPLITKVSGNSNEPIVVDTENLLEYIEFVVDATCYSGIDKQVSAFRDGFNTIFPISHLRTLTMDELASMIGTGKWSGPWETSALSDAIKLDHGFNLESKQVQWLLKILSSLNAQEQRLFLQFVTGSSKLPIGGFQALNPTLTIVRRAFDASLSPDEIDAYLPSVMTCVNYLKLPEYSSLEAMRDRLMAAIHEGQGSFHLS